MNLKMQFPYSRKPYTQKPAGSQKITGSDHSENPLSQNQMPQTLWKLVVAPILDLHKNL